MVQIFDIMFSQDGITPEEAEIKLDLSGMERESALQELDKTVIAAKRSGACSIYVTFDKARAGGGETLFQPVMRYFKVEKWNGYISRAVPVMSDKSGGLFVVFKK